MLEAERGRFCDPTLLEIKTQKLRGNKLRQGAKAMMI